jgi:hypothetical protein
VLKAGVTARYAVGRDVELPGSESSPELSGGLAVSLQVPMGNGIALLGTFSTRWFKGRDIDDVTTTSLTIAKAFGDAEE